MIMIVTTQARNKWDISSNDIKQTQSFIVYN